MGKLAHDRKIHFSYPPYFIEHYKNQSTELKTYCNEIGKPYGYSGMNVFLMFFIQYWTFNQSGTPKNYYKHEL